MTRWPIHRSDGGAGGVTCRLRRSQSAMTPSQSPEFRLAAACAIWPPRDRRNEAVRAAAAGLLDWPHFLTVALRHRVLGLVHHGLRRARLDVPPVVGREIAAQSAQIGA